MNKSDLIYKIAIRQQQLTTIEVKHAVDTLLDQMAVALAEDRRIEIRGFGSFSLHIRLTHRGRNPRTGESIQVLEKRVPFFRVGTVMKARINEKALTEKKQPSKCHPDESSV